MVFKVLLSQNHINETVFKSLFLNEVFTVRTEKRSEKDESIDK